MTISVLICTYKRHELLRRCLRSLLEGSEELPDEVVVVDGEEGGTGDIIEKWKERFPNIRLVPTRNINLAVSRNKGLPYCKGDIVALTDDDVMVGPGWVRKIKELHAAHPEAGGVGGLVRSTRRTLLEKVADVVIFPSHDRPCYTRTIAGANASYKKKAIDKVGEYDVSLFRGEDVDYNWRILKSGYKIYYEPDLLVYHYHRSSWKALFCQIFMYGRAYYRVREKWQDMHCVYPHRLSGAKDLVKGIYFFVAIILEPLPYLREIKGALNKCFAFPLLIMCQFVWKSGIIAEKMRHVMSEAM